MTPGTDKCWILHLTYFRHQETSTQKEKTKIRHSEREERTKLAKKAQKHTTAGIRRSSPNPTTSPPIKGLCMAERTGCPAFLGLWSYVEDEWLILMYSVVGVGVCGCLSWHLPSASVDVDCRSCDRLESDAVFYLHVS